MAVRPSEHVLVITDEEQRGVGEALRRAADMITPGNVRRRVLEDLARRPLSEIPAKLAQDVP